MNLVILPVLIPLLTALTGLVWSRPSLHRRQLFAASALVQLGVGILLLEQTRTGEILVLLVGHWPAPVGITLVVDLLSALMVCFGALVALVAILFGFMEAQARIAHPLRQPLVQFLMVGVNLSLVTGDLFNLFVAFEVMLIASYSLLTLEADNWDIQQAFPYVAINIVGSTFFLCAAGLTYSLFGSLNFADLAQRMPEMADDPRVTVIALLLLVVFGIRAGVVPLHYWLPNSYPTLTYSLAGLFGGVLTKVAVYVIIRVFGTVFPPTVEWVYPLLGGVAVITAVIGGVGAISRGYIRGILAFHIVSQIGLMLLALSLGTPLALAGALYILLHNMVVKSSLFFLAGGAACLNSTDDLERMGNLWRAAPWLGVLFFLQAMSLAGLPPLSGFWGKYLIVLEGFRVGAWFLVLGAMVAGMLTLFSMLKIWLAAFWYERKDQPVRLEDARWRPMAWLVGILAGVSLAMGVGAEPFMQLVQQAAAGALDSARYAEAVLGQPGKGGGW
jgi:multicomponent Na+:H+ antiporter subunit D